MRESKDIAKICTNRAASLKDWRITNKRTRAAREAARELLAEGGYFIGSKAEAADKWPGIVKLTAYESEPDAVFMWAFDTTIASRAGGRADIELIPIERQ